MKRLSTVLLLAFLTACQDDETIKDAETEDGFEGTGEDGSGDGGSGEDGSGEDGSGDGGSGDGGSDDGGSGGDGGWIPHFITMSATVGIDMDARTLHTFVIDGEGVEPWVRIDVRDEAQEESCSVYFVMDDPTAVSVSDWHYEDATEEAEGQQMHHVGFMVPSDATVLYTEGCETVDESVYGPIVDIVVPLEWGVGFGDLRIDVEEHVEGLDPSTWWHAERHAEGELFGASWSANLWDPTTWASHVSIISPAPTFVLEVDGDGTPVEFYDQSDIDWEWGEVPSGVFQLRPVWVWPMEAFFEAL